VRGDRGRGEDDEPERAVRGFVAAEEEEEEEDGGMVQRGEEEEERRGRSKSGGEVWCCADDGEGKVHGLPAVLYH